jgi:clan AA aspartic protease (TIGR02281 family)
MKHVILSILILIIFPFTGYGEMYKWVDEKGTLHFTDDLSNIPEKYRQGAETRNPTQDTSIPQFREIPKTSPSPKVSEPEGITVDLLQRGEVSTAEVILNGRIKQHFIVDTGASYTVINWETAKELDITIDDKTPFIPIATASSVIFNPLVTLRSLRVGRAEVENVDVLIHDMPSDSKGLLGNSFLNKFKVMLDTLNGKMTLYSMQGRPSPDRPGGYGKDFWLGRFSFYHRVLDDLKNMKRKYEGKGSVRELSWINDAIRYFENQLSELERKASLAGVPRSWRQ